MSRVTIRALSLVGAVLTFLTLSIGYSSVTFFNTAAAAPFEDPSSPEPPGEVTRTNPPVETEEEPRQQNPETENPAQEVLPPTPRNTPSPSPTPTKIGEFSGSVTDIARKPVSGATVTLIDKKGREAKATTDSAGLFVYRADEGNPLAIGVVTVIVEKTGYKKATSTIATTSATHTGTTLTLEPLGASNTHPTGTTADGSTQQSTNSWWKAWYGVVLGSVIVLGAFALAARALRQHYGNG